jgi:hypothetical protein
VILYFKMMMLSGYSVGVEEIADYKLFQFVSGNFTVPVLVDYLNVRGDIGGGGLETFVHGSVAVYQPLRYLDGLADAVTVAVVGLDDLSGWMEVYLARLRHSSLVKSPPF